MEKITIAFIIIVIVFIVIIMFVTINGKKANDQSRMNQSITVKNVSNKTVSYASTLSRANPNNPGHFILNIMENNPSFDNEEGALIYPTGVYLTDEVSASRPTITIIAGGAAYITGGTFTQDDDSSPLTLTILSSDIPSSLNSIPGPWIIQVDFTTNTTNSENNNPTTTPKSFTSDGSSYGDWRS